MACRIDMTRAEMAELLRKKQLLDVMGSADTTQDMLDILNKLNDSLETRYVPFEMTSKRNLKVEDGKVRVYTIRELADKENIRLEESMSGNRPRGIRAVKKASWVDKAQVDGRLIHEHLEYSLRNVARTKYSDKVILNNKSIEKPNLVPHIQKQLDAMAEKLLEDKIKKQQAIDPNQKLIVATEQILLEHERMPGTADVVFIFQKKTDTGMEFSHDVTDYKTVRVRNKEALGDWSDSLGAREIANWDFLEAQDFRKWNTQLGRQSKAMANFNSTPDKKTIVPIRVNHHYENNQATTLMSIETFVSTPEFLREIDFTPNKDAVELNKSVEKLESVIDNLVSKLSNTSLSEAARDRTKEELKRASSALKGLILERDITSMLNTYQKLIDEISIMDKTTNRVTGLAKREGLEMKDYYETLISLKIFRSLLMSTSEHYDSFKEDDGTKLGLYRDVITNLTILENKIHEELLASLEDNYEGVIAATTSTMDPGLLKSWLGVFSESDVPIIQAAQKRISEQTHKARLNAIKYNQKIREEIKALEEFGRTQGMDLYQVYEEYFINKDTIQANLHSRFTGTFWDKRSEALAKKKGQGAPFLKKHYKKKADADKLYTETFKDWVKQESLDTSNPKHIERINNYISNNSVEAALTDSNLISKYWEIDESTMDEYKTDAYKIISETPELKRFYDFWVESMRTARENFDMKYDISEIPDNFLAWYRANLIEGALQGELPAVAKNSLAELINLTADDYDFGDQKEQRKNPLTGEVLHSIPKIGVRRLKNTRGLIDKNLKSYDLGRVLSMFMSGSFHHKAMSEIEGEMDVLTYIFSEYGMQTKDGPKQGPDLNAVKTFKSMIDRNIRGVRSQQAPDNKTVAKAINTINRAGVTAYLAFKPTVQAGASLSAVVNSTFEGVKGYYYTRKMMMDGATDMAKAARDKTSPEALAVRGIIEMFNVMDRSESLLALGLGSSSKLDARRLAKLELPFIGFRMGKEGIRTNQFLALIRNYGINKEGELKRIGSKEGMTSVRDTMTWEDGKLIIPGILEKDGTVNEKNYAMLQNLLDQVYRRTTGEMNDFNVTQASSNYYSKLLMTFKNWLPQMTAERFQGIRYLKDVDTVSIGRLYGLWRNESPIQQIEDIKEAKGIPAISKAVMYLMYHAVGSSLKLMADIATFGALKNSKIGIKFQEQRAKAIFRKFKEDNANNADIQKMSYEDFRDYMQGQIRAAVVELRATLSLMLLILGSTSMDLDDDGEPDWKANLATRTVFRIANRMRRELSFFYSTEYTTIIQQNAIPILGYGTLFAKAVSNTLQESRDAILDIEDNRDKTPWYYYWSKAVPNNGIITSLDVVEGSEDKEF